MRVLTSLCLACLLLLGAPLCAQEVAAPGQWRHYLTHTGAYDIVAWGNTFFATNGTLLSSYNPDLNEYHSYTTIEGMHGNDPTVLTVDPYHQCLVIGYQSGLIDIMPQPGSFQVLADIYANLNLSGKSINALLPTPSYLYVAGDFGVVAIHVPSRQIRESYTTFGTNAENSPVRDIALKNDSLFVLMSNGELYAGYTEDNLSDQAKWKRQYTESGLPAMPLTRIFALPWGMAALAADTLLYVRTGTQWQHVTQLSGSDKIFGSAVVNNVLYLEDGTTLWQYEGSALSSSTTRPYAVSDMVQSADGRYRGIANGFWGLVVQPVGGGEDMRPIPYFPRHNRAHKLALGNGQLYITPCGTFGNFATCNDNSQLHYLNLKDRSWRDISRGTGAGQVDLPWPYWNLGYCTYDPATDIAYIGAWEWGILRFQNGEYLGRWDSSNSCLSGVFNTPRAEAIRVAAMAVQADGSLWTAGMRTEVPYAQLSTSGCQSYDNPTINGDRVRDVLIDDQGKKWMATTVDGILVWQDENSWRSLAAGTGSGNLPTANVNCLAKDKNGYIWVGTDDGITIFYNTADILQGGTGTDAICPLVNGFCLLRNTSVTRILVDGADRKWIATTGSGLYLVDPSGTKLLAHYEYLSSPLLSNEINDLALNPETGELFVATMRGLVSLKTDVTAPKEDLSALFVYPNPVLTNHTGPIAIDGGMDDALLRIVTPTGQLVRELSSKGGRTLWDGYDVQGRKVAPGVYVILAATKDGATAGTTKFVVVDP